MHALLAGQSSSLAQTQPLPLQTIEQYAGNVAGKPCA